MAKAMALIGNPSSLHAEGRAARDVVEIARRHVAGLVGVTPDELVFTSGGTEADCLGVVGLSRAARRAGQPARVVTTALEHPAIVGATRGLLDEGFSVEQVAVDRHGRIDLDDLARRLAGSGGVVAVSAANHEIGTVQDLAAVTTMAHAAGWLVHVDAVQAAGKLSLVDMTAADAVALSAHKIGGPKGAGALWVRRGIDLAPLWAAGHQERERRAGTENVVGIAGFGAAAAAVDTSTFAAVAALAQRLEAGLEAIEDVTIHGKGAPRIGNTVNARFAGALGEAVVIALDLAGIAASTGAACTSGSVAPSPVLLGLGVAPEAAREAVRFSLGAGNTEEEVERILEILPGIVARARRFR